MTRFDALRNDWDRIYRESPPEALPWEEGGPSVELTALIESGGVEKGAVLDICCGLANNAIYLAKHGYKCYGIDISPAAIDYARAKAAKAGVSCELTAGNALELPYPDNTFTLVFDRGCFHSLPPQNRKTFIRGVHRVLKPGGKYQLLCFSARDRRSLGPPYAFSVKGIKRYFSPLFKIHDIREISREVREGRHYLLSVLMEKPG